MTVATGHSQDLDSADAIAEALDACAAALGGKTPQAGLLFAGIDHDHQALLDGVEARYPGVQLVGCTTHGELSSDGFAEDSVVLLLVHSDHVRFRAGVGTDALAEPRAAARQALAMARDGLGDAPALCLTLPEGLGLDAAAVLDTLGTDLGPDVLVYGGFAADGLRFDRTVQFCNGAVYVGAVPVLLVAGPVRVSTGVASGWEPIGDALRATRVDGLVLHEIDGQSPRDVWVRYLGSADLLGTRGVLAVYPDAAEGAPSEEFYLCTPSHFQDDGSLATLNPVVEGARIRFTDPERGRVLSGAGSSAEQAARAFPGGAPDLALVFSCAARHAVLGTRVGLELGELQERLPADVPVLGFYTYGEICPLPASPQPFHHNCTFVTVLIGEDA
ncbi:FIST signal transduction protein [Rubrivirga sp. IMCC45206]|uniref:FIST signal transduction protein n=1 Tax=Rubrivirga sp. IMCC45206 TaxID=3391614 RepID=UPI00398FBF70